MNALVAAELRKATATRSLWLVVCLAAAVCAGWTAAQVLAFDPDPVAAHSMAQQGYPLAMIAGILVVAGEHRHRTLTWSYLVTPRRSRVLIAKLLSCGVIGLFTGLLAALVTAPLAMTLLAARSAPVFTAKIPLVLLGSVIGTALWCVFGAALAALVRNQSAAIAVALIWSFYAEWFLVMLVPSVGRWTPTGAAKAASGWLRTDLPTPGELLPMWAGALVFLAYAAAAAALAGLTTRRDVT